MRYFTLILILCLLWPSLPLSLPLSRHNTITTVLQQSKYSGPVFAQSWQCWWFSVWSAV